MIEVDKLEKSFRVARHHRGLLGAFRNLVETESDVVRARLEERFRVLQAALA